MVPRSPQLLANGLEAIEGEIGEPGSDFRELHPFCLGLLEPVLGGEEISVMQIGRWKLWIRTNRLVESTAGAWLFGSTPRRLTDLLVKKRPEASNLLLRPSPG